MLNQKVPPSNDHLLQLVAKIDTEGADRFLTKRNRAANPIINMADMELEAAPPVPLGPNAQLAEHQPGNDEDDFPL